MYNLPTIFQGQQYSKNGLSRNQYLAPQSVAKIVITIPIGNKATRKAISTKILTTVSTNHVDF